MLEDQSKAPANWVEDLARADEDIAEGRTFSAEEVLEEVRAQLAELEIEMAAAPPQVASARGR